MVKKHSELSGSTYAIFIPTLNPEEPFILLTLNPELTTCCGNIRPSASSHRRYEAGVSQMLAEFLNTIIIRTSKW